MIHYVDLGPAWRCHVYNIHAARILENGLGLSVVHTPISLPKQIMLWICTFYIWISVFAFPCSIKIYFLSLDLCHEFVKFLLHHPHSWHRTLRIVKFELTTALTKICPFSANGGPHHWIGFTAKKGVSRNFWRCWLFSGVFEAVFFPLSLGIKRRSMVSVGKLPSYKSLARDENNKSFYTEVGEYWDFLIQGRHHDRIPPQRTLHTFATICVLFI